ncbi:hypothetical protein BDV06DRAFT_210271 [Aspergillus oleicola]
MSSTRTSCMIHHGDRGLTPPTSIISEAIGRLCESKKILVFGATGGVGSAVARSANSHGSKSIPGLSTAEEQAAGYERVQADLTKPNSVREAVSKNGATHAFIYTLLGGDSSDYQLSTSKALKEAGIEQIHAQVEISLNDVFGPQGYVTVRPAFFSSNTLCEMGRPEPEFNYISPDDIGDVCGAILAGAFKGAHENPLYLCGPETDLSVADALGAIGRAIDKPVKVTKVDIDENIQGDELHVDPEHRANVERYLKRPATRFSEWAEKNKDKFAA